MTSAQVEVINVCIEQCLAGSLPTHTSILKATGRNTGNLSRTVHRLVELGYLTQQDDLFLPVRDASGREIEVTYTLEVSVRYR